MNAFSWKREGADASNIKQLKFEFQGVGNVYVDEISIVPYQNPYSRSETGFNVVHNTFPVSVYADVLPNSWAVGTAWCDNFTLDQKVVKDGHQSIRIQADEATTGCDWQEFGLSWNKWMYTNIAELSRTAALEFYLKPESDKLPEIEVFITDYGYHSSAVKLGEGLMEDAGEWKRVLIPLKKFSFKQDKVDLEKLKEMKFKVTGPEVAYLDEIRIVEFRGNPEKPFGR